GPAICVTAPPSTRPWRPGLDFALSHPTLQHEPPRRARGMLKTRPKVRARAVAVAISISACLVVASMPATGASAATPTWTAAGSAEQVYVTGVAPATQMSLITPAGAKLYTQRANSLGGLLFRRVPPG